MLRAIVAQDPEEMEFEFKCNIKVESGNREDTDDQKWTREVVYNVPESETTEPENDPESAEPEEEAVSGVVVAGTDTKKDEPKSIGENEIRKSVGCKPWIVQALEIARKGPNE